jgi:hypothetical protein
MTTTEPALARGEGASAPAESIQTSDGNPQPAFAALRRGKSPGTDSPADEPKRKGGPVPGTPSPMRAKLTPELHDHARRKYETTGEFICNIALDCGVDESTIRRMAKREEWVKYVAPPRDLPPVAKLLAQVEELEASVKAAPVLLSLQQEKLRPTPDPTPPLAALAGGGEEKAAPGLSLPPRSGGEGGSGARERDGVGWGEASSSSQTISESKEMLPPTDSRCSASAFSFGSTAAEGRLCPSPPRAAHAGGGEQEALVQRGEKEENITRFIRVVMAHLDEFEAMRRDGKLMPAHHLATARAISILTEAFNKLQRLRAAQPGQNHDDIADMPADLDEYRLELTRRIREFLRSRSAGRNGGRPAAPAVEGA